METIRQYRSGRPGVTPCYYYDVGCSCGWSDTTTDHDVAADHVAWHATQHPIVSVHALVVLGVTVPDFHEHGPGAVLEIGRLIARRHDPVRP